MRLHKCFGGKIPAVVAYNYLIGMGSKGLPARLQAVEATAKQLIAVAGGDDYGEIDDLGLMIDDWLACPIPKGRVVSGELLSGEW